MSSAIRPSHTSPQLARFLITGRHPSSYIKLWCMLISPAKVLFFNKASFDQPYRQQTTMGASKGRRPRTLGRSQPSLGGPPGCCRSLHFSLCLLPTCPAPRCSRTSLSRPYYHKQACLVPVPVMQGECITPANGDLAWRGLRDETGPDRQPDFERLPNCAELQAAIGGTSTAQ